ncbi:MAG: hypothetical protein AAFX85_17700, partial [Pseudomonadota bacterium]
MIDDDALGEAHPIGVEVQTQFVTEQSDPGSDRYVFAYTITIRNLGEQPARLPTTPSPITSCTLPLASVIS